MNILLRSITVTWLAFAAQCFAESSSDTIEQQWLDIIASGKAYSKEQLQPLYQQLGPISAEDIIGTWNGGKFDGGKPDPINWYGKQFNSLEDVKPLLVRMEDGSIGVFDKLGAARLREIKYQGVVSASLIYDTQPIMDYFRKVNDDLIIGWGDVKGSEESSFFFYLKRDSK
ncbi:DUF4334 domain-containing protein [Aurantivibrio plasticivorans]